MPSTFRFLRQYLRPVAGAAVEADTVGEPGAGRLPATVFRPAGDPRRRLPAWVVLHGLTRTGRSHPSLLRFARAVAYAGNVVYVPEIPEWCELRVAPDVVIPAIREAVRALQRRDDILHEQVGLFGFSFGATQALIAAADAGTAERIASVAAWGGYCDVRRLFHFGLTGHHEIDGVSYRTQPDPYGAWVMTGNYLPLVPGYEDSRDLANALHALAREAGDVGVYAWDPVYDASKRRLRALLPARQRPLFDALAPETAAPVREDDRLIELAAALAEAALRAEPLLDPTPFLAAARVPVLLAHGRDDRLVPFTESMRLARALPAGRVRSLTITSLFQHSGGTRSGLGPVGLAREGARFALLLHRVLRPV